MNASISDPASGSTSIAKTGAGNWTVGGSSTFLPNTFTGNVTVSGGTLAFTGNINTSSAVSVAAGSTLNLSNTGLTRSGSTQSLTGNGTVLGSVSVGSNSVLTPGDGGSFGVLTVSNLTLTSGSFVNIQLGGGNSSVNSNGFLTLSGGASSINIDLFAGGASKLGNGNSGQTYTIFNSLGTLSGTNSQLFWANSVNGLLAAFTVNANSITVAISGSVAQISNWNLATGGSWNSAGSWDAGGIPNAAQATAIFGSAIGSTAANVTLDGSEIVGEVDFNNTSGGQYTVSQGSGGSLILNNNGATAVLDNKNGNHTISAPVSLVDAAKVVVDNAGDTLTISGVLSNNTTAKTLTVAGPGTLVLTQANTYGPSAGSTGTILTGGTVQLQNAGALGAGDVAVNNNAKVQAGANGLTVANNVVIGSGVTATVDTQANNLTLSGVISEASASGGLAKTGSGVLQLTGAESYTGATTVTNGTLQVGNGISGSLNSGSAVSVAAAGVLAIDQADTTSFGNAISNNGTINTMAAGANALSGAISGTGSLTQSGTGNTTISGTNTFTGNTVISGGQLILGNSLALQGSTLNYNNQGGALSFGTLTSATLGGLSGGQDLALANSTAGAVDLTVGGNGLSTTYSGNLSGTGNLTKNGVGKLSLTGTSSFSAILNDNAGIVELDAGGKLDQVTAVNIAAAAGTQVYVHGGNLTSSGAFTVREVGSGFLIDAGNATFNGGVTIPSQANDGSIIKVAGGSFTTTTLNMGRTGNVTASTPSTTGFIVSGGTATVTGNVTVGTSNSNSTVSVQGGSLTVGGALILSDQTSGGRGALLQVFNGSLTNTDATDGLVLIQATAAGQTANVYFAGGNSSFQVINYGLTSAVGSGNIANITVNGGNLYVGSGGIQVRGVGMTSSLTLISGNLGASADWSSSMPMTISGGSIKAADSSGTAHNITLTGGLSGGGALTKTGAGVLNLGGSNGYTGATNVNAGELNVTGTISLTSAVNVNATGTLTGNGVISSSGLVTLNNGGTILAGAGTGANTTLTMSNLRWNSGAIVATHLVDGVGADNITVTSALTNDGGANYTFDFSGVTLSTPYTYKLISFASETGYIPSDLFATDVTLNGLTGNFEVNAHDISFVTSAVPEPAVYAVALGGVALVISLRRRNQARA
jgi:autotransporter-associated beta strand protein